MESKLAKKIEAKLEAMKPRSCWERGVIIYAYELLESYEESVKYHSREANNREELKKWLLNGASDWQQYSEGGCSLVYDEDIAERLCTPSELKKTDYGRKRPNAREEWLDTQARALEHACHLVLKLARYEAGLGDCLCMRGGVDDERVIDPCSGRMGMVYKVCENCANLNYDGSIYDCEHMSVRHINGKRRQKPCEHFIPAKKANLGAFDNENLSGINNTQKVPDWSNDTPEAARDRGFRLVNGCPYFRNILNDYYLLNETNISFGDKIVKGRYAVVDLYHIQPSHINGQRNPRYFLDEAQPKNRIDQASVLAYKNIAKNLRPEEIIDGNTAFIGAPIVNYKGEVIQGNNRIMALRELFDNNAEYHNQLADYSDAVYLKIMKTIDLDDPKNYSFEIDSDWGWHEWEININGQITISHPIIVRLVDVIDFTAIMLGQKTAQDTESGGEQALDTNRIRTQLSDEQFTSFANILLNSYDDDESLKETITCNASEALKFLYKLKTINDTQFQTALKENGLPTDKTIDSLMELLNENIFNNADTDLRQRFNALPNLAKRGLLKVMHRDVQSPKDSRIKNIVQEAINAFDKIKKAEDAFAKAKTEQEADSAVKFWSTQTHIDFAGVNSELFSQEALKLASVFRSNTQKQITQKFNKFFDYVQGKGGDIFNKVKQLPFAEAFDVVFDLSTIKVIPRAKDEAQVQSFRELTDEEIILKIKLMNTIY